MPDSSEGRRCIVVAPFYPPSALPPAHRARLFVRHLPSFGWTPTVVTVDARDREEAPEPALELTLPPGTRTERVRALPARLTRWLGFGDLALRAFWPLAWRTVRVAREAPGAVVLLIIPPWYALWLAPLIAWAGRARVVVDYVDPWRIQNAGTLKSRAAAWIAAHTEALALSGVSGLFGVAIPIVGAARRRRPDLAAAPAGAAPYGFEPTDWALTPSHPTGVPEAAGGGTLRMVYVGAVSDAQMPVLTALLDALAHLRNHGLVAAGRLRLELYGTTYASASQATPRAAALVHERGLDGWVVEHPVRIPYVQALTLMAGAGANIVLGDTTGYYAASKLIPLLSARRPVLAVLQAETEPARLLGRLTARGLVCYGSADLPSPSAAVSAIAQTLLDLCHDRIPIVPCNFDDPVLASRTAAHMTGELARVLDQVSPDRRSAA